jgi:hypothetical protein
MRLLAADTTGLAVGIQRRKGGFLAERDGGRNAARRRAEKLLRFFTRATGDVPFGDGIAQRAAMHVAARQVQQFRTRQFAENAGNAAGTMHVFDMVFVGGGRRFAQARHFARDAVDVGHREIDAGFLRGASRCSTVLVEPPMATSSAMAFSNACLLAMLRGRTDASSS